MALNNPVALRRQRMRFQVRRTRLSNGSGGVSGGVSVDDNESESCAADVSSASFSWESGATRNRLPEIHSESHEGTTVKVRGRRRVWMSVEKKMS